MFFHDLLKNVRRLDTHNIAYDHWAKAKCFEATCSKDIKRDVLFSLCIDKNIMLEINRMLGDIGIMYNKSGCFGNFL